MPPKKGFKHTPETCKKYSESKMGSKNPMFGKKHTEEFKNLVSKIHTGKTVSEETRNKISESLKKLKPRTGWKHTEESKKKMSESRKGIVFSETHLKNLSESHKGQKVSEEGRKKRSEYNKSHPEVNARLRTYRMKKPSKPQLELYKHIMIAYPNNHVETEWKVVTREGNRFIDVAIPELMLGWEFDGVYWHKDKESDQHRHELIEELGWKLTHYSSVEEFKK